MTSFIITQEVKNYITDRFSDGWSLRMVSNSLGVDHSSLSKKAKLLGIQIPSKSESAKRTWVNHRHPRIGKVGVNCPAYGRKMPDSVKEKLRESNTGPNNYHWSGGRKLHSDGYVLIYQPNHPQRDKNGFVLEHRLVYEQHIGRYLKSTEIVHHINGDKSDNRLENLALTNREEHARLHMIERYHHA